MIMKKPLNFLMTIGQISLKCKGENIMKIRTLNDFKNLKEGKSVGLVKWLEFNNETLSGKILELPTREDVVENIEEHLIVELYSK